MRSINKLIFLIISFIAILTSCRGEDSDLRDFVYDKVTNVYKSSEVDIQSNIIGGSGAFIYGERIYFLCTERTYVDNINRQVLYSFDFDGANIESEVLSDNNSETSIINYFFDSDGNEIKISGNIFEMEYRISKSNQTYDLQELLLEEDNPYFGVLTANIDKDNNIYIASVGKLYVLSPELKLSYTIEMDHNKSVHGIYTDKNGNVIIKYMDRNNLSQTLNYIDPINKSLGEQIKLPRTFRYLNYYELYFGDGYDMYIKDSEGLYGYNNGDENVVPLINWTNSDLIGDGVSNIIPVTSERIVCLTYDYMFDKGSLNVLTKIPDDEIKEQKIITLALLDQINPFERGVINKLNRGNIEYRIIVKDYAKEANTENPISKFDRDILSGDLPDMVYSQMYGNIRNYAEKGLFDDLYKYFKKDKDISEDILFECVRKPFEINGELNSIPLRFSMEGRIGKTSILGSEPYTLPELIEFEKSLPEDTMLSFDYYKSSITGYYISLIMANFIDYDSSTCDFENQEFYDVLTYLQSLPEKGLYDISEVERYCKEEKIVLYTFWGINSFHTYLNNLYRFNTNDISFMRYPYETFSGIIVAPKDNFMIVKNSPVKDKSWEFIKNLLVHIGGSIQHPSVDFPSTTAGFHANAEMAMMAYYYYSGGESAGYQLGEPQDLDYNSGTDIVRITENDIAGVASLIELAADYKYVKNLDEIFNLIDEEIQVYYNGGKSIEETAKIIQSRVSIYLSENY